MNRRTPVWGSMVALGRRGTDRLLGSTPPMGRAVAFTTLILSVGCAEFGATTVPRKGNRAPSLILNDHDQDVAVGTPFSLIVKARGVGNEVYSFGAENLPSWLTLSRSGVLRGRPSEKDVGAYPGIVVSVSDGTSSAVSNPFTLRVVDSDQDQDRRRWRVLYREDFENTKLGTTDWVPDDRGAADGPFGDDGEFFSRSGGFNPRAFRAHLPFGVGNWLAAEAYSRSDTTSIPSLLSVVDDPAAPGANKVLRLKTRVHTDAIIVRGAAELPSRYRIKVRVGYAEFGDGRPNGENGYDGDEFAGPWHTGSAVPENGFYWLSILDTVPRPHNNIWIHHHRKFVIDSDNNYYPGARSWSDIYDGRRRIPSGEHPLFMLAIDGKDPNPTHLHGHQFYALAAGAWQRQETVIGVDSYKPRTWYEVTIERFDERVTLTAVGDFRFGGRTIYRSTINAADYCVFHFNQTADAMPEQCVDDQSYAGLEGNPRWPRGKGYPDYFMVGEPHVNYYEGEVYYDDFTFEVWE